MTITLRYCDGVLLRVEAQAEEEDTVVGDCHHRGTVALHLADLDLYLPQSQARAVGYELLRLVRIDRKAGGAAR